MKTLTIVTKTWALQIRTSFMARMGQGQRVAFQVFQIKYHTGWRLKSGDCQLAGREQEASRYDGFLSVLDVMPTLLELAGVETGGRKACP